MYECVRAVQNDYKIYAVCMYKNGQVDIILCFHLKRTTKNEIKNNNKNNVFSTHTNKSTNRKQCTKLKEELYAAFYRKGQCLCIFCSHINMIMMLMILVFFVLAKADL